MLPVCLGVAWLFMSATNVRADGLSAETLFPSSGIRRVEVSPTGKWLAAIAERGQLEGLLLRHIASGEAVPVFTTRDPVGRFSWVGPDTLLVEVGDRFGGRISRIELSRGVEKVEFKADFIDAIGWLVDPLPLVDGEVIWAFDYNDWTSLHRVSLEELVSFGDRTTHTGAFVLPGDKLVQVSGSARKWVLDRDGFARAYLRVDEERTALYVRKSALSGFRRVLDFEDEFDPDVIVPVRVSSHEGRLIVAAYGGQDTKGLFEFDLESGQLLVAIFQRPDVDVQAVVIDEMSNEIAAIIFEVDGRQKFHYLDTYAQRFLADFESSFARDEIQVLSGTLDRRFFVFRVAGPTNPGDFYLVDRDRKQQYEIARTGADIVREDLSKTEAFVVESRDGTEIEAFLTMPAGRDRDSGPVPLVVMPHGGPIGVRDSRSYDPIVQYLASWGFAVLQPNYRGSGGYGRRFREAGESEWARGIEDDIDASVEHVMAREEIDATRICIAGGSYGGFSALASVVRHAGRYRCAISWNGVSDVPLMFDSSDGADSESATDRWAEITGGGPEKDRAKLVEISPAYHLDQVETPIFLIYGTEDRRVDPDHSHRVMLMLETYGKPFEFLEVEGMAHSYFRNEGIIVSRAMRRYLSKYLMPEAAYQEDPRTPHEDDGVFLPRFTIDR